MSDRQTPALAAALPAHGSDVCCPPRGAQAADGPSDDCSEGEGITENGVPEAQRPPESSSAIFRTNGGRHPERGASNGESAFAEAVSVAADGADKTSGQTRHATEGQRRLANVPGSLSLLASALGCARQSVADWRNGAKVPSAEYRAALLEVFGIPPESWFYGPGGGQKAPKLSRRTLALRAAAAALRTAQRALDEAIVADSAPELEAGEGEQS